jgi:hypothetical protein
MSKIPVEYYKYLQWFVVKGSIISPSADILSTFYELGIIDRFSYFSELTDYGFRLKNMYDLLK